MNLEEARNLAAEIMLDKEGRDLTRCEEAAIDAAWNNESYYRVAGRYGLKPESINPAASHLWKILSKVTGEKVKQKTFRPVMQRLLGQGYESQPLQLLKEHEFLQPLVAWIEKSKDPDWQEELSRNANFSNQNKPTPSEAYKLIDHLICRFPPQSQEWESRRALGNALAWIFSHWSEPQRSLSYVLDNFSEKLLESAQGQIMLSIGMAKAGRLDITSQSSLDKLLKATHPQISWTLAKDWQSLEPSEALLALIEASSDWTRRRLIFSLSEQIVKQKKCSLLETKLNNSLLELFKSYEKEATAGFRYMELLDIWLQSRRQIYFSQVFGCPQYFTPKNISEFGKVDIKDRKAKILNFIGEPQKLATFLDLCCLDIDIEGSAHKARGRYDTMSDLIELTIEAAGLDINTLSNALVASMSCHDEGIRWAIGNKLPDLYKLSPTLFDKLAPMLLKDENDWPVREAVRSLDRIDGLDKKQIIKLADQAAEYINDQSKIYNRDYVIEIDEAFEKVLKRYSYLRDRYTILKDGRKILISWNSEH